MPSIGLVLGAGGIAGQAYHAGVLAALEQDLGWDARTADVIVGTSAGSITASLLRGGVPASDLAAWTTRAPLSLEGRLLKELFSDQVPELEPLRTMHFVRPPSLPGRALIRRVLLRPWQPPGAGVMLTLLAPGEVDISQFLDPLRAVEPKHWHDADLWVCAVRRRDGRRVVFGRAGAPRVPLHLAVAASCAVPGYFAPVVIEGVAYVDGGVHSPTNAAVLSNQGLQVVVVVSPMSGAHGVPTDVTAVVRRHAGFRLGLELRALKSAGVKAVLFEPDASVQEAMGGEWMSRKRVADITRRAFASSLARVGTPEVRAAFAGVRTTPPAGSSHAV